MLLAGEGVGEVDRGAQRREEGCSEGVGRERVGGDGDRDAGQAERLDRPGQGGVGRRGGVHPHAPHRSQRRDQGGCHAVREVEVGQVAHGLRGIDEEADRVDHADVGR